jgi:hypothetical protein
MTISNISGSYKDCKQCLEDSPCKTTLFEVSDCCGTLPNQLVYAPSYLGTGSIIVDTLDRCWEIELPVSGTATIIYNFDYPGKCEECTQQYPCQA